MESVDFLLQQAEGNIEELERKEKEAIKASMVSSWFVDMHMTVKLRYILFDLYSVLDYVYFMLYCHFSNDGKPDYSKKGIQFGFPTKPSGVEDQQKFVKEKMTKLFDEKFTKESHFWKDIGSIILSVQPKLSVDGARESADILAAQESLALLHYYRNCATHKSLVQFVSRKSWVEINQITREIKLVNERCEKEGYFYRELDKAGYWIYLPVNYGDVTAIRNVDEPRLLLDVLHQLMRFVKTTSSKLLSSSLLFRPQAKPFMRGCTIDTNFKPADQPMHPTCSVEMGAQKSYRMVLNELQQKLSSQQENKIRIMTDAPQVEEQYFEATVTVCFETSAGARLCTLTSHKHKEHGKNSAIEAACEEIAYEAARLGILRFIQVF